MHSIIERARRHTARQPGAERRRRRSRRALVFVKQQKSGGAFQICIPFTRCFLTRRDSRTTKEPTQTETPVRSSLQGLVWITSHRTRQWRAKTSACAKAQTAVTRQARCNVLPAKSRAWPASSAATTALSATGYVSQQQSTARRHGH